jgi:NAD(P)-dependent dehydrogenase (short-subunit alcohol dehydrogenase family)
MPTVLITGANRGIGLEFVKQYSSAGWKVLTTVRDPQRPGELSPLAALNNPVGIHTLDIANENTVEDLVSKLNGPPRDLLVHNAAI